MSEPQGTKTKSGLSRRDFLRGSGAAAASALTQSTLPVLAGADEKPGGAAGDAVALGPGPVKLELNVNGQKMTTSVEPRVTLGLQVGVEFTHSDGQQISAARLQSLAQCVRGAGAGLRASRRRRQTQHQLCRWRRCGPGRGGPG